MAKLVKLKEPEARVLALQIAASFPNHQASTADVKKLVPKYREFSEEDLLPSKTRQNETMWQQIIGNATASHNKSATSLYTRGLAVRTRDGLRVTEKGLAFLKAKGLYP
ncbi:MAG: hypothetical protein ACYC1L_18890 [Alphaproteobacteria bacterium]